MPALFVLDILKKLASEKLPALEELGEVMYPEALDGRSGAAAQEPERTSDSAEPVPFDPEVPRKANGAP